MILIIILIVFIISIVIIEVNSNYTIKIDKYEPITIIDYKINENENNLSMIDKLKKNKTTDEISIEDYIGIFYFENENENENYGFYIYKENENENENENNYNLLESKKIYNFNIPVLIKIFNIKNEKLIYYLS